MPSQATRTKTTVDLTDLGFDTDDAGVDVAVTDSDDGTVVTVEHETASWTLTFDEYGDLTNKPARSAPRWLGPAIKKAAPGLRVV